MFSRTTGHIDDRWQAFMKFQIARARQYFADAEAGVDHLDTDARWPVWSALILYRSGSPSLHIFIMNASSHDSSAGLPPLEQQVKPTVACDAPAEVMSLPLQADTGLH